MDGKGRKEGAGNQDGKTDGRSETAKRGDMKKDDIVLGRIYLAKISGSLAPVRIMGESQYGGWDGENLRSHHRVRIKSAAKLRREVVIHAASLDNKMLSAGEREENGNEI